MGALVIQGLPPELLKREALEAQVERLIALLDALDGDVNLEPDNDDEPSLGWPEGVAAKTWTGLDDREQDAGDECEQDADDEPDADGEASHQPPTLNRAGTMSQTCSDT